MRECYLQSYYLLVMDVVVTRRVAPPWASPDTRPDRFPDICVVVPYCIPDE
jgi:hypothetical protein